MLLPYKVPPLPVSRNFHSGTLGGAGRWRAAPGSSHTGSPRSVPAFLLAFLGVQPLAAVQLETESHRDGTLSTVSSGSCAAGGRHTLLLLPPEDTTAWLETRMPLFSVAVSLSTLLPVCGTSTDVTSRRKWLLTLRTAWRGCREAWTLHFLKVMKA